MRLIQLSAENFKRLSAVRIAPTGAVTPITGKNGAGKTSVLDAIAAALGGATQSPGVPIRKGEERAEVVVDLDDIVVTRRWTAKGSSLEVATKDGAAYKSPQAVLDKLVGELSFDPLAFGRMKPLEQAAMLARAAGIDLAQHRAIRLSVFEERTAVNRKAKELRAQLAALPETPPGVPDEEVSLASVMDELNAAETLRRTRLAAEQRVTDTATDVALRRRRVEELRAELRSAEMALAAAENVAADAKRTLDGTPEAPDTEAIRRRGRDAEGVNRQVRAKQARAEHVKRVEAAERHAEDLTNRLAALDADLAEQLAGASLPIPGLSINEEGVTLGGIPFAQCSGAERLRASVGIGLALNPKLKLMLIRDGSLLDDEGMKLLAELAEAADAQVLIERVSNGVGVGVRIVDGTSEDTAAKAA